MAASRTMSASTSRGSAVTRFTDPATARAILAGYDGLLVPGGFGVRGVDGMVEAIRTARETGLPFFGHLPRDAGRDRRVRPQRDRAG